VRFSIAIYFLLISFCSAAQWVPFHKELDIRYSNDSIRAKFLVTDYRGMVWIGTNQGLIKIAGQNLSTTIKFPHQITTASAVDSTIWVGTETGEIYVINPTTEEITSVVSLADSSAISAISSQNMSTIVSTRGEGLFYINGGDTLKYSTENALSDNYIYDATLYNGEIFCASDGGIDVIKIAKKEHAMHFESSITMALSLVDSIVLASSHRHGLISFSLTKPLNTQFESKAKNLRVSKIKQGFNRVFVLTAGGIYEYQNYSDSLSTAIFERTGILDFTILKEGVILALCEDGSISIVDLRFSEIKRIGQHHYTALTTNNDLLYVADTNGIYRVDIASGEQSELMANESKAVVVSMAASEKELFIGTFNHGLLIYNMQSGAFTQISTNRGLPDNNVLSMSLRDDTLWFATLSGISSLAPNRTVTQYPNSGRMRSTYVYSVLALDTCLYIGTDGKGLFRFDKNIFSEVNFAKEIQHEAVYHISTDGSGDIWLTTKDKGLMKYEKNSGALLTKYSVKNREFMATGGPDKSAIAVGKGWVQLFSDQHSILLENEETFGKMSGAYLNNISFDGSKTVFFASNSQIFSFLPTAKFAHPSVILESLQTNLNKAPFSVTTLDSEINHITYSFGAIWYQGTENVKFRYRLKGLEDSWNETMGNSAVYPNLKYGSYTFEVEVGLGDEYYPNSLTAHAFTISKPIYLKWWFVALVVILVGALVYPIMRWQIARTKMRYKSEKKLIETELAVLRNQVNPHFLFNSLNTLMNLIETEPREAEDYLHRLSDFYRKILETNSEQIVSVKAEVKNLKDYIYLQKKRFGEGLILEINLDSNTLRSKIPALTFQLLAENAIKHNIVSRNRPLTIKIFNSETHITFFNLKAAHTKKVTGTGTGLKNIESRYKLLFHKSIQLVNNETDFIINLPIIIL